MIAALPFYEMRMVEGGVRVILGDFATVVPTGPIPVDPWATLVCLGVLLGLELARARGIKMGLDVRDVVDGIVFIVLFGFLIAHVFTVVAYFPERLSRDGVMSLLRVWEGFSSTGGFLGGIAGMWLFYGVIRPRPGLVLRFADLFAYGFPLGWFFGRLGCAVVHDHIGQPTDFALGVAFPVGHYAAGVRHELGLYEMLLTVPMIALYAWLGRKDQPPGTFLGIFFIFYAPVRFGLDALRSVDLSSSDARYLGLTPAQYGMIAAFLFGVALVAYARRRPFAPWALDGQPDQAARAAAGEPSPEAAAGG
ncbi:MAG: prolipoprotein diacylglyceryl transferase [Alphaproteobacteria bacterium]|nr:prolipoprotein diacylglyceryl transferase [Alphaproteobacteria bacterium]